MATNLDRYKNDLQELIAEGERLNLIMQIECFPDKLSERLDAETIKKLKKLPSFGESYEAWYSEAKSLVTQLLPDRLADFVRRYEKPKPRKDIDYENYRIEDYLQGLQVTRGWKKRWW